MWQAILESSTEEWLRKSAEHRLLQLRALDDLDALQRGVDSYVRQNGSDGLGWPALVRARVFPGLPVDPTGVPYELTPDARVQLSPRSPLLPLPTEPAKAVGTVS